MWRHASARCLCHVYFLRSSDAGRKHVRRADHSCHVVCVLMTMLRAYQGDGGVEGGLEGDEVAAEADNVEMY